jgi:phage protein D
MMLIPAYKLTIGDAVVDTTDEPQASTLVDLTVALDMDAPADSFTLVLGQVGRLTPARDDESVIELGYADNGGLTQVMSGTVVSVEPGLTTNRVIGHGSAATLLRTFADETFESQSAGDIVRDLAGRANVGLGAVDDGIEFPAYVIDGRRSAYHHMRDLADLCGFDLYINADGELVFQQFGGGNPPHVFDYAKHILKLDDLQTAAPATQVESFGESAGSNGGDQAWAWLTKDFSAFKGTAGSGNQVQLLERPVLRTAAAAGTAAQAALTEIERRTIRGRLLTVGRPQIKLGDSIRIGEVPQDALNGEFQVRAVEHRITKAKGFTTNISFRSF